MSDSHSGVPNVRIIPPLVYLAGVVIGIVISIWIPTKIAPSSLAWTLGGIVLICGVVLAGSAIFKFKNVGTTVRPDRAANTLVIVGLASGTLSVEALRPQGAKRTWLKCKPTSRSDPKRT